MFLEVFMGDNTVVWTAFYYLAVSVHYASIGFLLFYLGLRFSFPRALAIYFGVWLCSAIVFNGCIFAYLEQYCALKAGMQTEITYNLKESLAYKIVLYFFL